MENNMLKNLTKFYYNLNHQSMQDQNLLMSNIESLTLNYL